MLQHTIEYCATFRYCIAVVEDPSTEFLNERQWWIEEIENSLMPAIFSLQAFVKKQNNKHV